MKLNVCIDSFNLYYGSLKETPYKWLNVLKMCELLFPKDNINKIKYFTARPHDLKQPIRQNTYFRALKLFPIYQSLRDDF